MATFTDLGLSESIIRSIINMGFEETTPIQEQTIPIAMEGRDLIGQAQTGTGKTAAYGIPLIERIVGQSEHIQGIVLAPTRELAVQVAEELNKIGQYKRIHALPIYGGQGIEWQIRALKKRPHIIVATPGRLMDHMRRKTIRLNDIKILVLDEADEMLNMGFLDDIETILKEVPEERQTLLFSATMPRQIQNIAHRFMQEPQLISIKATGVTVSDIEQHYVEVTERLKFDVLSRILDIQSPELSIVFARTKKRVDELAEALSKRGYSAEGIHGDLTQNKRDSVLRQFKDGTIEVLVATDVAARGLDISGVTHVFNFDIPQDPESYVHRVGRTGRAGKSGLAITLVTPREIGMLRLIESVIKRRIVRKPIPTIVEAVQGQQRLTMNEVLRVIAEEDIEKYKALAEELLAENDSVTLLSAALKIITKEPEHVEVQLTEAAPVRRRGMGGRSMGGGRGMANRPQGNYHREGYSPKPDTWSRRKANDYRGASSGFQRGRDNKRNG
ncbi:DNA/RNA helicase, superfamily II [Desulfosporosinus orientis DSM 765]|uniref:ATP-dependent RNA helicase CshA n=1 Tax=Desulfosporosinus orientis (strain ATCC 19365 / DSM 765 / NCIMB 8382 / VKM B-1628 / Singapore I) TaxID=768706 RepID=G7WC65_DESOD|nr:DEAD/DEAH box helicase [Desulfosporosinus orientis]AET70683.1 DNA/RNA helicase, superfamily II [Desulfosporosinus orientis DSM 765]